MGRLKAELMDVISKNQAFAAQAKKRKDELAAMKKELARVTGQSITAPDFAPFTRHSPLLVHAELRILFVIFSHSVHLSPSPITPL